MPSNGQIDGFTGLKQAKCTYCREVCDPPIVDATIHFLDGFGENYIGLMILFMLIISVSFEIFKYQVLTPQAVKQLKLL